MSRNSKDLFDENTMSFGEHLEVLRVHLWKAIIGLVIGVLITLLFGDRLVDVIRSPVDKALRAQGIQSQDDISGFDFWDYLVSVITREPIYDGQLRITDEGVKALESLPRVSRPRGCDHSSRNNHNWRSRLTRSRRSNSKSSQILVHVADSTRTSNQSSWHCRARRSSMSIWRKSETCRR